MFVQCKTDAVHKRDIDLWGCESCQLYKRYTSFLWKVDKSAQLFKSFADGESIPNMSVRLVHKINVDCNDITGCAMSEAGNMLFLQTYQNSLVKYGPDGQFYCKSSINPDRDCSSIGFDFAMDDSHTAAVLSGSHFPKHIHFIDMDTAKLLPFFF